MLYASACALAPALIACSDDDKNKGGADSGGSGNDGQAGAGPVPDFGELGENPAPEADWTFLVYGHGDHNLSNSLLMDLQEMALAQQGAPGSIHVLALTDWDASQIIAGTDPPEAFPEGVQLFRVPGGGRDLELLAEGPEANLDDPRVLSQLVGDVFTAFPSRRRAVVLWDHGGAWSGGFGSDTQNGTLSRPSAMPVEAIPAAIAKGLAAAGVKAKPPLDIVAFDTCLMAGAEVIYPMRDLARVFIGNAEIDYGAGWDFTATLTHLAKNPDDDALAVAEAEVGFWQKHHATATTNDALLRSHVALDLSAVPDFARAAGDLTTALAESTTFPAVELARSSAFALPPYASQFETASSQAPGLRDFGQILDTLSKTESDDAVAEAASTARSALEAMVVARSQGTLRSASKQAGVHIELGLAADLDAGRLRSYAERASEWAEASGWHGILSALSDAADSAPPSFLHSVQNAEGASREAPPLLDLSTLDADTAKGAVYLGTAIDSDTVAFLGLIGSGALDPESDYQFEWDGAVATFPDGQPAMLDVWLDAGDSGELVLMAPGLLTAGGEQLEMYLVFTPSEGAAATAVISLGEVASTLGLDELVSAFPDATFTPYYIGVSVSSGETGLLTGEPLSIPRSGLIEFSLDYAQPGTYLFFTSVTDVWGNSSTEADAFELLEPLGD